jgi:mono/diheme cytochrome c family protein
MGILLNLLARNTTARMVLTITVLSLLFACSEEVEEPVELTTVEAFMLDSAAVERGQALFLGSCSTYCHTLLPAETDALFLFDCQWKHGGEDQQIFDVVTTGIADTRMVGFGSNFPDGDDDLWKIIAYMRTNQQPCA